MSTTMPRRSFSQRREDLRPLREVDGATRYAYRGYEFTAERSVLMWWCHSGYSIPGELICTCHEAGWGSFTRRAVLRKVTRSIDGDIRRDLRRGGLDDRQPDMRIARGLGEA